MNKKGQSLPMNVVILGIIVIVVLIIVLIFFVGGTAQVTSKIRDIFTGRVSGQAAELTVEDCKQLCESAKALPAALQKQSGFCTKAYTVNLDNTPTKVICGQDSLSSRPNPTVTPEEESRGIKAGSDLGVSCAIECV